MRKTTYRETSSSQLKLYYLIYLHFLVIIVQNEKKIEKLGTKTTNLKIPKYSEHPIKCRFSSLSEEKPFKKSSVHYHNLICEQRAFLLNFIKIKEFGHWTPISRNKRLMKKCCVEVARFRFFSSFFCRKIIQRKLDLNFYLNCKRIGHLVNPMQIWGSFDPWMRKLTTNNITILFKLANASCVFQNCIAYKTIEKVPHHSGKYRTFADGFSIILPKVLSTGPEEIFGRNKNSKRSYPWIFFGPRAKVILTLREIFLTPLSALLSESPTEHFGKETYFPNLIFNFQKVFGDKWVQTFSSDCKSVT